jgi:alkaline phosphatase D
MKSRINRRVFGGSLLKGGFGAWALGRTAWGQGTAPAVLIGSRPGIANGIASGDVTETSAVIWSRTDREARMIVEWDTTDTFGSVRRVVGPVTGIERDHTAKVLLTDLPAGERIFYRVRFEESQGGAGEAANGSFRTASSGMDEVHFAWSGDTCGQGFGIDPGRGGMLTYDAIRRAQPQFFVHSGDTIYADNPLRGQMALPNGSVWNNLVTEEKSKVAETLAEFRGNYRYALLDVNVRRMLAEVPMLVQWDDHEVLNNWWPGQQLPPNSPYAVRDVNTLAARSKQAFFDYHPITDHPDRQIHRRISRGPLCELFFIDLRSHRGPNSPNRQTQRGPETDFLGAAQLKWLGDALASSRATWKFVCSDMPLGLMIRDTLGFENGANGDGPPLGRELELMDLLKGLKDRRVRNVVWLTADVHYCASHHYNPSRAVFTEFDGFWEFVSGPLHAGTFGPAEFDPTFGPELKFSCRQPNAPTSGPWTADQFFGTVRIDPRTKGCRVTHWNRDGDSLWSQELAPAG